MTDLSEIDKLQKNRNGNVHPCFKPAECPVCESMMGGLCFPLVEDADKEVVLQCQDCGHTGLYDLEEAYDNVPPVLWMP